MKNRYELIMAKIEELPEPKRTKAKEIIEYYKNNPDELCHILIVVLTAKVVYDIAKEHDLIK